jgi:calcineurin-like phosphoesterase family protein
MEKWYISDTHFGHANIIKYCGRPFQTPWEMNDFLCTTWNKVVKPQDHIYHLGDVTMDRGGRVQREAFCKLIRGLNGHKRLFLGNHDHWPIQVYLAAGFEKIYATWKSEDGLLCSHMPVHPTSIGSATCNVHGHIHQNPSPDPVVYLNKEGQVGIKPYINVSVEVIDYTPIHYDELKARIDQAKAKGGHEITKERL